MISIKTNLRKILTAILCAVLLMMFLLAVPVLPSAHAEEDIVTVLDDFSNTGLNIADYPVKSGDYSLQIIQIAETDTQGIVVYVYQPSGKNDVRATGINLATDNVKRQRYDLTYLGNYNTLFKYKVQGVAVSYNSVRRYDITSIYRAWEPDIDGAQNGSTPITEIAYPVGAEWVIDNTSYNRHDVEVITITDEYIGLVRYASGLLTSVDNNFVAFSTYYKIDNLIEADVYYESETHLISSATYPYVVDKVLNTASKTVHLSYTDVDTNTSGGTHAVKYTWNCIQSVADFLDTEQLEDSAKAKIIDKQWVLRYLTEPYVALNYPVGTLRHTIVTAVTMVSLKFVSEEMVYELGVVNDTYLGSFIPDNTNQNDRIYDTDSRSAWQKFWDGFTDVLGVIGSFFNKVFGGSSYSWVSWVVVIFVIFVILLFLPVIGPLLLQCLVWIGKGLLWLIMAPVRLVRAIIRRGKDS
ncbi:MAG: hypothetical protein NC184_01960 [Roseburia sp.]|nr:hypothetical protein [Roseburia sp.]